MELDDISNVPLLPVRDQGKAQTCLAFATSFAHENLHGTGDYLSPAYLYGLAWKTDPILNGHNGLTIKAVRNVISDKGQVHESVLPYEEWLKSIVFPNATYFPRESHFLAELTTVSHNFDEICQILKKAIPVILGVNITDAFHRVDKNGYIAEPGRQEMGGHAIVALGRYQNEQSKNFLLIRNSWGIAWGKEGYALISQEYLMKRLMFAAILKDKGNLNGTCD
ncbi:MAG: C1 family peptidase [Methyloglobulus sp.]|nr:C1 family peptidase [Methyloglobulus sp.]